MNEASLERCLMVGTQEARDCVQQDYDRLRQISHNVKYLHPVRTVHFRAGLQGRRKKARRLAPSSVMAKLDELYRKTTAAWPCDSHK